VHHDQRRSVAAFLVGDIGSVRGSEPGASNAFLCADLAKSCFGCANLLVPQRAALVAMGVVVFAVMVPVQFLAGQACLDLHAARTPRVPALATVAPTGRDSHGVRLRLSEAAEDRHSVALHCQGWGHDDLHAAKHGFDFHVNDTVGNRHRADPPAAPPNIALILSRPGRDCGPENWLRPKWRMFLMLACITGVGQSLRANFPSGSPDRPPVVYRRERVPAHAPRSAGVRILLCSGDRARRRSDNGRRPFRVRRRGFEEQGLWQEDRPWTPS